MVPITEVGKVLIYGPNCMRFQIENAKLPYAATIPQFGSLRDRWILDRYLYYVIMFRFQILQKLQLPKCEIFDPLFF